MMYQRIRWSDNTGRHKQFADEFNLQDAEYDDYNDLDYAVEIVPLQPLD